MIKRFPFFAICACCTLSIVVVFAHFFGRKNFGFINGTGKLTINLAMFDFVSTDPATWFPHEYATSVYSFSGTRAPIELASQLSQRRTLFSFLTPEGKILSQRFSQVGHFSNGLAMARSTNNEKCGYVNTEGVFVISPIFDDARVFSEGLAAVKLNGRWGFIDSHGIIKISPRFADAQQFSEGVAGVKLQRWGLINKTGKYICIPKYGEIFPSTNGLIVASREKIGYNWQAEQQTVVDVVYLDLSGKELHQCKIDAETLHCSNSKFIASYLDPDDSTSRFANTSFSNELSVIKIGTKYGYINKSFKIVIAPIYDYAYRFSEGRALVFKNIEGGLFAYIDDTGRPVTNFQYVKASRFSENLAVAYPKSMPDAAGYIDKNGRWVIKPAFRPAYPFSENKAQVGKCFEPL